MLGADVEPAYARLREAGFWRGNVQQIVSHLLAVGPRRRDTGVERFCRVADHLKSAREHVRSSR